MITTRGVTVGSTLIMYRMKVIFQIHRTHQNKMLQGPRLNPLRVFPFALELYQIKILKHIYITCISLHEVSIKCLKQINIDQLRGIYLNKLDHLMNINILDIHK